MKKLTLLILACLVAFNIAEAQITRQQADALVTNQIFSSSLDNVDIYAFPDLLTSHDEITLADGTSIAVPYQTCYAYFVDLMPFANWSHPCKYCFVNSSSRQTIVEADMLPIQEDLVSISLVQRNHPNPDFVIPENASGRSFEAENTEHKWAVLICGNANGNGTPERFWFDLSFVYTVLANTYHYQESTTWLDTPDRRIFVSAGFNIRNMYKPSLLDDEYPDLNGNNTPLGDFLCHEGSSETITYHTKSNLHKLFKCFADGSFQEDYEDHGYGLRKLTEEDQLFIFITGHGQRDNYGSYFVVDEDEPSNDNKIYDYQLAEWLRDIKCSQITLMMENCYSGGFVEKFYEDIDDPRCQCKNRVGFSAASADGISFVEGYGVHNYSNRDDHTCGSINEFVYYWASAALGYYPFIQVNADGIHFDWGAWNPSGRNIADGTMNWRYYFDNMENIKPHTDYEEDPDTDSDGILSFKELFEFANNLDSWSWNGYYCPVDDTLTEDYEPEFPQSAYESTFTAEAATLRGYEGQVDGDVTSGTAEQPYRLVGDLWTGPHTRVDMTDDIYVPEGNKIYIQPSSYIQLRNCTADKLPESNGMWEGFQVWGQYDQPQDLQHQGGLYMYNASIRNAVVAVDLWNPWQYTTTGGIFRAYNSTFINNAKGLRIEQYQQLDLDGNIIDYNADLKNCTFLVNDDFIGTENFYEHVKLVHVKGLRFDGCQFKLELEHPNSHVASWAKGILAFDAGFRLDSYDWQGNLVNQAEVKGLFMGVHAVHDLDETTMPFNIFNTNFVGNDCGVFASQVGFPTIVNSNFLIGRQGADCAMGIYAEGINDFIIEQNSFRKAEHAPQNNYGIVIKESNSNGTQIYNNNFSNLYCGNLAIGDNRVDWNHGLKYFCNNNNSNNIDFYVWNESGGPADIQMNQGQSILAAGNTFSQGQDVYHFYNGGDNQVNYYYHEGHDEKPTIVHRVKVYATDIANECPLRYDTHVSSGKLPLLSASKRLERETDYYNALSTYNSVKTLYNRLTDGGNTNGTIADIKTANPWQMWDLRAQLLGASPYLSEKVLKEAADRDDVFTESVLFEILASNPDELKRGDIIDYVKNKTHPLPEYMTDILEQVAAGNTYKTVLLNQMSSYSRDYHNAATDIIRSILADSIVNTTELRGWLGNLNDLGADREIIASYMAEGDFDNALALANMLPALYEFGSEEMDEHADYMRMLNLYRILHQAGRNTRQLTQQEIEDIEDIAENSTGTPQRMAQNILEANSLRHFADCPNAPYPGGERGSSAGQIDPELFGKAMGLSVEAKPNPATTWVAIDYTLPGDAEHATLTLTNALGVNVASYNLNGHEGQKVLDLRELSCGIYTYTIYSNSFSQTGKLVVAY